METTFYAWRRELIIRAREDGAADELTDPKQVTPNEITDGRGRKVAIRYRQTDQSTMEALYQERSNPFVPIRLLNAGEKSQAAVSDVAADGDCAKDIEIVLPGGARIRLGENSNVRLVAELLSALKG